MRVIQVALLGLIVATAFACSNDSPATPSPTPTPTPTPTAGTNVSIVSGASTMTTTAYSPNPVNVAVGGTVTWVNNDNTAHTSTANGGAFDSGTIAPGASFSRMFPSAGSFPYHCTIHPGMVGTVNVQ